MTLEPMIWALTYNFLEQNDEKNYDSGMKRIPTALSTLSFMLVGL